MIYDNGSWTNYDAKNLALNIREIATDKKSPQPIERLIDITSYVEGGKEPYTYKYYVNGNELVSEGNKAQWLPTEIGQYNILVEVTDRRGSTVTKEITYDIKDKSLFQTTIFYKGYSNPYIKYSVGGRDWTPNNGILITASETREGYYEITIDLGDVTSAEVCFNDGKGNWDNNKGANYRITSGEAVIH